MKHAFLIIAHNNWWQLKQLISMLDYPDNDIYVHIDKKSTSFSKDEFLNITKYSNLSIYQEYEVFWGGFSLIEVELFLGKKAQKTGYDYYHYISGSDLPLKSNSFIHDFFEEHKGCEFIQYDDFKLENDPEISRRTRLYHFLQNYRRRYKEKYKNDFFTFIERVLLLLQIRLRVNRTKDNPYKIRYGSQWVSITNDLMKTVLEKQNYIEKTFKYTNCSDELFIQTIAYNCGFKDRLYKKQGNTDNLRFIDWARGSNGNPYTFKIEDYDVLSKTDALFARKFSETVDKDIIKKIVEK